MNIHYKKGVIELCVLSMLAKEDRYGYDVSETISKSIDISDGTVYPILRKLKSDGLVTTYVRETSGGPPRIYYRLTDLGRSLYHLDRSEWLQFVNTVKTMLEDESHETK